MAISSPSAITPSSSSTQAVTAWPPSSGRATLTVRMLLPIIDRYRAQGQTVVVRADAAFALPALYEALERRGVRYAIRLPANDVLERGHRRSAHAAARPAQLCAAGPVPQLPLPGRRLGPTATRDRPD